MALPPILQRLRLPVIGAPMFIAGNPKLVIEQCKAGIVGSFPALNARPKEALDDWLSEIEAALEAHRKAHPEAPPAPFAVNQIAHKSNDRLEHDVEVCVRHKVPITITSLRAPTKWSRRCTVTAALCCTMSSTCAMHRRRSKPGSTD